MPILHQGFGLNRKDAHAELDKSRTTRNMHSIQHKRFFSMGRKDAQVEFNKSIAGCYRDGNVEYDSVGVLLLTWKDDDLNCKEREVRGLPTPNPCAYSFC